MDPDRINIVYDIKRALRKGQSEDVFTQFMTLGGYSAFAAVGVFALHLTMARLLGPADYAAYGTYVAILFTVYFMLTSIHLIITRFISYHKSRYQYEQINYIITHAQRVLFVAGLVAFGIILLAASRIRDFFHLEGIGSTVVLGFVLWFTMLVPVFEGAFKGLDDFKNLGRFRITESIIRLIIAIGLVFLGFQVAGALFGLGLGTFIALAFSYRHLYHVRRLKMMKPDMREIRNFAIPVFLTMIAIALLLNLDIILVKHFFPAMEAGVFAAASLIAKLPFFVSMVFVSVMFPKITQLHADGKNSLPVLKHALQIVVPLVALFTLVSFFVAEPAFTFLFGPAYSVGPALGFYVFGMGCLAITVPIAIYLLAVRRDNTALMLPVFFFVLLLLLIMFHATLLEVMITVMLIMTVLLAYILWSARNVLEFDYFL